MPTIKFPPKLIEHLKKLAPVLEQNFESLENADHRKVNPCWYPL